MSPCQYTVHIQRYFTLTLLDIEVSLVHSIKEQKSRKNLKGILFKLKRKQKKTANLFF